MAYTIYHQIVIELRDCIAHITDLATELEHIQIGLRCPLRMRLLLCTNYPEFAQPTLPRHTRVRGGFRNPARRRYSMLSERLAKLQSEEEGLVEERMLWLFWEREMRRALFASGVVNQDLESLYYDL